MVSMHMVVHSERVQARLTRLAGRLRNQRPQLLRTVDQLLRAEASRFAGGRLVASGRLMRSLTDRTSADLIIQAGPHTLTFGTRVPYAKFHRNVDGQPLVGINPTQKRSLSGELKRLLVEDL